eukprot:TRINITY_DN44926_c0_g1_i1.p1 TRINITY_DN44926_c0_g1~~TRINITY_DN44926_c0_g1_i1.p1  ORF type:complete len:492 (+),score=103.92 TRINITY_DN44926_c0_g1_i1:66-1478(+)
MGASLARPRAGAGCGALLQAPAALRRPAARARRTGACRAGGGLLLAACSALRRTARGAPASVRHHSSATSWSLPRDWRPHQRASTPLPGHISYPGAPTEGESAHLTDEAVAKHITEYAAGGSLRQLPPPVRAQRIDTELGRLQQGGAQLGAETMNAALVALAQCGPGAHNHVHEWYNKVKSSQLPLQQRTFNALVTVYAKMACSQQLLSEGSFGLRLLFRELKDAGWEDVGRQLDELLTAFAECRDFDGAQAVALHMHERGVRPTVQQHHRLLQAASRFDQAEQVFLGMRKQGFAPRPSAIARVVELCEDAAAAEDLVAEYAPHSPSPGTWAALLGRHAATPGGLEATLRCYLRWRGSDAYMTSAGYIGVIRAAAIQARLSGPHDELLELARAAYDQAGGVEAGADMCRAFLAVLSLHGCHQEAWALREHIADTFPSALPSSSYSPVSHQRNAARHHLRHPSVGRSGDYP